MTVLQTVLLIAVLFGVVIFGYFVMDGLDRFIDKGGLSYNTYVKSESSALLFGQPEITKTLGCYLHEQGISYKIADNPDINVPLVGESALAFAAAVSKSDTDNLLLCTQVKKLWPKTPCLAICNDNLYIKLFKAAGIERVITDQLNINEIISALKGLVDIND